MRVVIAGGTGFIGRHLSAGLLANGDEVIVLSRSATADPVPVGVRVVLWDPAAEVGAWSSALQGAGAVINLAGTSIGSRRWTRRRMDQILASRLRGTRAIVKAMGRLPAADRPPVLLNASGIDYYGDRGEEMVNEQSGAGGSFLAHVCQQWEAAALEAEPLGTRVVLMRTALVFGREAAAFRLMVLPFRTFAGGPLGNGSQWFTWIQIEDLVGLYRLALDREAVRGPLNAVAPDLRRQRQVAAEIGRALHRPSVVPAPAPLLRLALGKQADLLLHGRRANSRAAELGYQFRLGDLPAALQGSL
ncbi:MAG TPA: TIGR01777 family oxidoreductase [Candidatus Dormibacteraeota bacterium]